MDGHLYEKISQHPSSMVTSRTYPGLAAIQQVSRLAINKRFYVIRKTQGEYRPHWGLLQKWPTVLRFIRLWWNRMPLIKASAEISLRVFSHFMVTGDKTKQLSYFIQNYVIIRSHPHFTYCPLSFTKGDLMDKIHRKTVNGLRRLV